MEAEQIFKKEEGLGYRLSPLQGGRCTLILTQSELRVVVLKKVILAIPLKEIQSANSKKGIGTGVEKMLVLYSDAGKEKKLTLLHVSFMAFATVGNLSRIGANYFSGWEQAINDARFGRTAAAEGGLDDLEKLAGLRDRGIITDAEFSAKKKQVLGI